MDEINKNLAKKRITYNKSEALNRGSFAKHEPKDKPYFVRDIKLRGFWIRVYPSGIKSYGCTSRKGGAGKPKLTTIGQCDIFDFEEAKNIAREYIRAIKVEGVSPKEIIRAEALRQKTILHLVEDYIDLRKDALTDFTKTDYKRRIVNRMKALTIPSVNELTKDGIVDWWKASPRGRSDVVAFLYARKVCSVAVANDYLNKNPFSNAKEIIGDFPKINKIETHVSQPELSEFFESFRGASSSMKRTIRDYLMFILTTGKRKGEVESLTWDDVDFENGTITLKKTKTKKIDVVPMTNFLYLLLRSRANLEGIEKHHRWVFPSHYRQGIHADKHISNPYKSISKITGFELSPHDFRRTFSTATRELGITNEDLSTLLNHASRDVTEGYVFASLDYKRNKLEEVIKYYNSHTGGALNWMMVYWYEGNTNLFSPEPEEDALPSFAKQREYLLAENED